MCSRIERIRKEVLARYPESQLEPLSDEELSLLRSEYPTLPEHLFDLYQTIGWGNIGESGFMIHRLGTPESIYDPITASELAGIRIVGDDFSGWCVGYDIENNWVFGGIEFGKFTQVQDYETVLDLIENWFLSENAT